MKYQHQASHTQTQPKPKNYKPTQD